MGPLMGEHNPLLIVIEQFDQPARQHNMTATAGERERKRLLMTGDLDRPGVIMTQAAMSARA